MSEDRSKSVDSTHLVVPTYQSTHQDTATDQKATSNDSNVDDPVRNEPSQPKSLQRLSLNPKGYKSSRPLQGFRLQDLRISGV